MTSRSKWRTLSSIPKTRSKTRSNPVATGFLTDRSETRSVALYIGDRVSDRVSGRGMRFLPARRVPLPGPLLATQGSMGTSTASARGRGTNRSSPTGGKARTRPTLLRRCQHEQA
jgi:hypothetical protein